MALLGLVVVLFVVRPLVRRILDAGRAAAGRRRHGRRAGARRQAPHTPRFPTRPMPAVTSQTAKMIDMAQVQGQVHAQSIQKVGELAERNPHETVAIVRQWLQDAPA